MRIADQPARLRLPLLAAAMLWASAANAGVFEVGADGAVTPVMSTRPAAPPPLAETVAIDARFETMITPPPAPVRFAAATTAAAVAHGLSPDLLAALVSQESGWNPRAVSRAGAIGLGQLMPATAAEMGVDPRDPTANLHGAAFYLRAQLDRFGGDVELALAAYNAGPGRVRAAGAVPAIAETQAYVRSVMTRLANLQAKGL